MRWGKHAEEGFGGKLRVPPNIKQVLIHFDTPSACGGELHSKKNLTRYYFIFLTGSTGWTINFTAAFALTQVLLPLLKLAEDASVVFTSSGVGRVGRAYWGAYSASKFATESLSQVLADEHRNSALRSNCINPGATRTNMRLAAFPAEDRGALKTPEEILASYIYLLGPDSKGVTGESYDAQ